MNPMRKMAVTTAGAMLAMITAGFAALGVLPEGQALPIHWGISGEADGWMPAHLAIWVMPLTVLATAAILGAATHFEPEVDGEKRSGIAIRVIWPAMLVLFGVVQLMIVAPAFGWNLSLMAVELALGVLFIVTGNVLPKTRPGLVVGVRLPRTLANTDNWIATHRFAGRCMITAGALVIVLALAVPAYAGLRTAFIVAATLAAGLAPVIYSWRYSKKA